MRHIVNKFFVTRVSLYNKSHIYLIIEISNKENLIHHSRGNISERK